MAGYFVFDSKNPEVGFSTGDEFALNVFLDILTDTLYYTDGSSIFAWEGGATNKIYTWKSGKLRLQFPMNLGGAIVEAESYNDVVFRLYALATPPSVPELITNGDFTNDIASWAATPVVNWAFPGVASFSLAGKLDQTITTVVGEAYDFLWDEQTTVDTFGITVQIDSSGYVDSGGDLFVESLNNSSGVTGGGRFIATSTSTFIRFLFDGASGDSAYIDNISVKLFTSPVLVLKHTQVVADNEPFRLPGGYLSNIYEVDVVGTDIVSRISIAESMFDLVEG